MIIFKDVVSGDEICSDSFRLVDVDDLMYKVDSAMIPDPDEDDENPPMVINVIKIHDLRETSFDKKTYGMAVKGYMAKVVAHLEKTNPDRVAPFKKAAQEFIMKTVFANMDDWQFYCGSSMDPEGMVILARYEGENATPTFYFWKDGVVSMKC